MTSSHTDSPTLEPRRRRDPDGRPSQILDAALEAFGEHGFAAARIDDIAHRANLAKGTIYLYFPTKEDLFKAVVRREIIERIETGEQMRDASRHTNTRAFLAEFLTGYWAGMKQQQSLRMLRMAIAELHKYPDLARFYGTEVIERGQRLVASIVQQGIDRGEFRPLDTMLAARCISAAFMMHKFWCDKSSPGHQLVADQEPEELRRQIVDFFMHALEARDPAALALLVGATEATAQDPVSRPAPSLPSVPAAAPGPVVTLSLGDAARLAARQSAATQVALARADQADARVTQRRADLLPFLNATALEGERNFNSASFGISIPGGPFPPGGTVLGPVRNYDLRGNLRVPLLDLSAWAKTRSARTAADAARADAANSADLAAASGAVAY
ncbi:MAG: TetR/AcrR family transcriptional regulator, partial [Gemmatimonadetes bacterium]|nr:TetR/AcrR family transcriptional regulator [Gemmatimonadota bacterium]